MKKIDYYMILRGRQLTIVHLPTQFEFVLCHLDDKQIDALDFAGEKEIKQLVEKAHVAFF